MSDIILLTDVFNPKWNDNTLLFLTVAIFTALVIFSRL